MLASTASPMAYSVCCTDLLICRANTSNKVSRTAVRKVRNGIVSVKYFHRALTSVPNNRSVASGKVVSESLMNPTNSEPAVFIRTRPSNPDRTNTSRFLDAVTSVTWHSPLDCTNVVGCNLPAVCKCSQFFSLIVTPTVETCGFRSSRNTHSSLPKSSMHSAEDSLASEYTVFFIVSVGRILLLSPSTKHDSNSPCSTTPTVHSQKSCRSGLR